ncbi:hypothetical protein [Streptomyces sp. NPDC050264]|uniref:hypothetical protein n=1 Tax=Streptomyces sp. NPDC050264 TaxID=3155038 RepID=UPI0034493DC4
MSATDVQAIRATERSSASFLSWRPGGLGASAGEMTQLAAAADVEAVVLPGCGRYPAEEAPEAVLSVLTTFPAP